MQLETLLLPFKHRILQSYLLTENTTNISLIHQIKTKEDTDQRWHPSTRNHHRILIPFALNKGAELPKIVVALHHRIGFTSSTDGHHHGWSRSPNGQWGHYPISEEIHV